MTAYQGPTEGFRGEVRKAAIKVIKEYNNQPGRLVYTCPSCGENFGKSETEKHVEGCIYLRSDVAEDL